jgi:hypothetical protein
MTFKEKQRKTQRVALMATVDRSHRQHINKFEKQVKHDRFDYRNRLQVATKELALFEKRRLAGETITDRDVTRMSRLRDQITEYRQSLSRIEAGHDELEYIIKNGDGIVAYYDITKGENSGNWQDKPEDDDDDLDRLNAHMQNSKPKKPTERKVKIVKSASVDMRSFFGNGGSSTTTAKKQRVPSTRDSTRVGLSTGKGCNEKARSGAQERRSLRAIRSRTTRSFDSDIDSDSDSVVRETADSAPSSDSDSDTSSSEPKVIGMITGSEIRLSKADLADQFFIRNDPTYKSKITRLAARKFCKACKQDWQGEDPQREMVLDTRQSFYRCRECGDTETVVMDTDRPSYKEPMSDQTMSPYKRINH